MIVTLTNRPRQIAAPKWNDMSECPEHNEKLQWNSSSGSLDLELFHYDAQSMMGPGAVDTEAEALVQADYVKVQTSEWDPAELVDELSEFGMWDEEELKDHDKNILRMVWIAGADMIECLAEE